MKLKIVLVVWVVLCVSGLGLSADETGDEKDTFRTGPAVFEFSPFLIEHMPGGFFYTAFLENYAPDTTFLIEENNAFSLIDNPRVYFEGDSFVQFNWFYNGVNINSALNDGSPGVLLPFSAVTRWRLQGETPAFKDYGMHFISGMPDRNFSRLMASTVYSDLGGYIGTFTIQPDHPATRADRLYTQRRKVDGNFFLDYQVGRTFKGSQLQFAVNYFDIRRQFNDFNEFDSTFKEDGKLLLMNARFKKTLQRGYFDLFTVYNLMDRSNHQAELGSYPQETSARKRHALLTGAAVKHGKLDLSLSLLLEKEELSPVEENFSKDLVDNDGDLTLPYGKTGEFRWGDFRATTLNVNLNYPVIQPKQNRSLQVEAFADLRYSMLKGSEENHDFNALLFDNTPYLVAAWIDSGDYTNTNLNAKAGLKISAKLTDSLSLLARVLVNHNRLSFDNSANNIALTTPGFDAGVHLKLSKRKNSHLLFAYGRLPYHIRENSNFFLEQQRPFGVLLHWNDTNGDLGFQPGEQGALFGYTGGLYHHVDENLSAPIKERLLLNFSSRISRNFILNIKAIYKKIKNNLRVRFHREYGFYENVNGYDFYFFDQPFTDYYLGSGGYEKDPFYAQFHFNFKGRRANRWFFSFSFMAHMGMGVTAFGNGPASSDIGILDESQANPNSSINGFGRVDGDRGFVAKSYFGYYIAKRLFLAVSLKYRDGNPFAFFGSFSRNDQRIIYYQTIKAENEKGVKGGPREDYVADVSVKLSYRFRLLNREAVLSLSFFNLLDFGAELSEYVYSGGLRHAVELQIPRSLRLSLDWRF
jgi:hypothetical protein